jgi:transposase
MDEDPYKNWFILLSNEVKDPKSAIKIYRNRNIVEEAFNQLKNILDQNRLSVHSSKAVDSKLFINFISMILISKIHLVMDDMDLYKSYTLFELFLKLNQIKITYINDKKFITPVTAAVTEIYKAFKCPLPIVTD